MKQYIYIFVLTSVVFLSSNKFTFFILWTDERWRRTVLMAPSRVKNRIIRNSPWLKPCDIPFYDFSSVHNFLTSRLCTTLTSLISKHVQKRNIDPLSGKKQSKIVKLSTSLNFKQVIHLELLYKHDNTIPPLNILTYSSHSVVIFFRNSLVATEVVIRFPYNIIHLKVPRLWKWRDLKLSGNVILTFGDVRVLWNTVAKIGL